MSPNQWRENTFLNPHSVPWILIDLRGREGPFRKIVLLWANCWNWLFRAFAGRPHGLTSFSPESLALAYLSSYCLYWCCWGLAGNSSGFWTRICFQIIHSKKFPSDASDKEPACQCSRHKRCRLNPWVRKIPWRRKWQPSPIYLSGESHGQRSLAGYSPWGQRVRHGWSNLACTHSNLFHSYKAL